MPKPPVAVAYAAVHIVGLPGIVVDKFCKIPVMHIPSQQIQSVIGVGAGSHIDIRTAAKRYDALSADRIVVEGVYRLRRHHRKCPRISPCFRIIRR